MIPRSVRMHGWMRYRDEQVADFGDGRLIAICGENGAGKSSIFDAITFALYGQHRLGKMHADQLISEDMDRLSVEFEFEAEHNGEMQRFLVRRSRGRRQGERDQGLWLWDRVANDWTQVAGTEKEDALERALAQLIRLSAAAFTSSFILQQGEATEFIDADPKHRFDIIGSLIGLAEYEQLERRAREAARDERRKLDELTAKLEQFAGVDEAARDHLREIVAIAAAREATAAAEVSAAVVRLNDARRYSQRVLEIAALDARVAEADELLMHGAEVERDAELFATLSSAVATIKGIRNALADAEREEAAARDAEQRASALDLPALDKACCAAEEAALAAVTGNTAAQRVHAAALKAERAASDFLVLARAILVGRKRLAECEATIAQHGLALNSLPEIESQSRTLAKIKDALPALSALREALAHLEQLGKDVAAESRDQLEARRATLISESEAIELAVAESERAMTSAQKDVAASQAQVSALVAQIAARKGAAAEATCSRCGQPVDKKQALAELKELNAALADVKAQTAKAASALAEAQASCTHSRERRKRHAAAIAALAPKIAAAELREREEMRASEGVERRRAAFNEVAPTELVTAAAAAKTSATIGELIATHGDVPKRAELTRKKVEALRGIEGQRMAAIGERDRLSAMLGRDESSLGGRLKDVPNAERNHAAAATALQDATAKATAAGAEAESASKHESAARAALATAREQRAQLDAEIAARAAAAAGHRGTAVAIATGLGDEIGRAALADPDGVLGTLDEKLVALEHAPEQLIRLNTARADRQGWVGELSAKQGEVDAIPAEHRMEDALAAAALGECEATATAARDLHDRARQDLSELEVRLNGVAAMKLEKSIAELRRKRLVKLVRLLGKNGLQGALITDALAQITSHANAFLRRITGGSLLLSIERGTGDELQLQAIDTTCMRVPHPIKALSGSQKFRCAVAIASGIGQYAGAGGMRSIVIDEGFASLDQPSQQMMVEELKELATHMEKVIVVSHLEAFTNRDNFPEQLLVEAAGNGSRIRRTY